MFFQVPVASAILATLVWWFARRRTRSPLVTIPGPDKDHWLTGNYHQIFRDAFRYNLALVARYGGVVKINALLGTQQLYISDPLALYHVVVKDQHIYTETDMFITGNRLIFGPGLISTLGDQHRKQRKMLNPVFSLANMRDLLPVIQPIADSLCAILQSQLPHDRSVTEINILPWLSRGALEYICQATLGHSFDALNLEKENEYLEAIRNLAPSSLRLIMIRPFIPFIVRNFSLYWRNKVVDWIPLAALKELRRVVQVMDTTSRRIFSESRAIMDSRTEPAGPGSPRSRMKGKDIMSIMLEANMSSSDGDRLTDEELLGQIKWVPRIVDLVRYFSGLPVVLTGLKPLVTTHTVVFAGFETTTTAICRILWILAGQPDVQARLRSEVRDAKQKYAALHDLTICWEEVGLPYDVLMDLPYLDAVVRETLRVYPPTSLLSRTAREDAVLPLHRPMKSVSGEILSAISIPKGTTLIISLLAANHDKHVWGEDASEWRPERWFGATATHAQSDRDSEPLTPTEGGKTPGVKGGIKYPGVYGSMMTFLGGGRACIGFKFAEMEMKQVLATLVPRVHFALPGTPDESGHVKEIYWKVDGLQVPVVRPPAGDGVTAQVPLDLRSVGPKDFA